MARHRLVKALDLDDELNDYDGAGASDDEQVDAEAEQQLREGTVKVRAIIGNGYPESEIHDTLWHYYYDVEKTVKYLLGMGLYSPYPSPLLTI